MNRFHSARPCAAACALLLLMFGWAIAVPAGSEPSGYAHLKQQGEEWVAQKSYARAHTAYRQALSLVPDPEERRWVEFRLADTQWRAAAATDHADPSALETARTELDRQVRDRKRPEEQDRIWAEVQESLGDWAWTRAAGRNWGAALPHYRLALEWWAGSKDIERARRRYLNIVWTLTAPPGRPVHYDYGYFGNVVESDILDNALKIAETPADRARAAYFLARELGQRGDPARRTGKLYEQVIAAGKSTEWYDDALFHYGDFLTGPGEVVILADGREQRQADYVKGLSYFRRLIAEFEKGETRHYDEAARRVEAITRPGLDLNVPDIYLPGSRIRFDLNWRNVKEVAFSLMPVDLTRDVPVSGDTAVSRWKESINPLLKNKLRSWTVTTQDQGEFRPGSSSLTLDETLPAGAYLLIATGGGVETREIVLVTRAALVLKTARRQGLAYFCDAGTGAPLPGAHLQVQERYYTGKRWTWRSRTLTTDKDGLARFELNNKRYNSELFLTGSHKGQQAFLTEYPRRDRRPRDAWKLYVHTDRPAYRPGETTHWKVTARLHDGSSYSAPAHQVLEYRIDDPKGARLQEGRLELNEFGGAWDALELPETLPLGMYRIQFWDEGRRHQIGRADLFRLEEYKLPEFKVSVQLPEKDGKKSPVRLGETIETDVEAEYYFGGGVASASVEVLVYQRPFQHHLRPTPDYPWYYGDLYPETRRAWGRGQQVLRQVLTTDAGGRAHLSIPTQAGGQDMEYEIEARVTDASRREVIARESVRVTRQAYYAYLNPAHYLHRPQDRVRIEIRTLDANQQPHPAEGRVRITRDFWYEIWTDPEGREVRGEALEGLRRESSVFPPPAPPGRPGWQLKFRGYHHDEIGTRPVRTGPDGAVELAFTPEREGYYRFAWTSGEAGAPVTAETTVWVATHRSTELGYRHGGLEIIADRDSFRAGQKAPVMLVADSGYVLFSVEGEDLYDARLVRLGGSVKLIELEIGERHVPNVFLEAVSVRDRQIQRDTRQIVVPPVRHFLDITVTPDRETYLPRDRGAFTLTARDAEGRPVSAEVSLALVDDAVFYIQDDLAGDPRQFFFGTKRRHRTRTVSSFQMKRYARTNALHTGEMREEDGFGDYGLKDFKKRDSVPMRQDAAMPMESRMSAQMRSADESARYPASLETGTDTGDAAAVQVRSDFRSTVFWSPSVRTDARGRARVEVSYPDSLTQWRATARAVASGHRFGMGVGRTRTRQPLIVRLEAPRFFVAGDRVTLSAVIHNNTETEQNLRPFLEAEGLTLSSPPLGAEELLSIPAGGEARVDWWAEVPAAGPVRIRAGARGEGLADAMEKTFTAHEHGLEKLIARSGKMTGGKTEVTLNLPAERRKESTRFSVQVTPSLAVTMLDALPYLIEYPYGCTEQTLSRFLPAVITHNTLTGLGLDARQMRNRVFGGIDPRVAGKTHPGGKKDLDPLDDMVKSGLERLYDFQHADGGWGWWKEGESDPFMTAYALWGLALAQRSGIAVTPDVLTRARDFLDKVLVEAEQDYNLQAWLLHALATSRPPNATLSDFQRRALDNLWRHRDRLNAYGRALFTLAAHGYGEKEKTRILVENLENGALLDRAPGSSIVQRGPGTPKPGALATVHWGEDGLYGRWSQGGVEATATVVRALMTAAPGHPLIGPAIHWLIQNRRGAHWSHTRETALAVLTLNQYLQTSGELDTDAEYAIWFNGRKVAHTRVTDVLQAPGTIELDPAEIRDGDNRVRLERISGRGPLYYSVQAEFFSREEPVTPAGNALFVQRQYYRLVGRPTLLKGYVYDRVPLNDPGEATSGERIETVLTIEAKNNLEYLVFEDLKPAGFEAVQIRSGEALLARELKSGAAVDQLSREEAVISAPAPRGGDFTGRTLRVHQELRDRKVALFLDKLPQGIWQIRYDLRAEAPGRFHALPLTGQAMYIPEIRANGAEVRVAVRESAQ